MGLRFLCGRIFCIVSVLFFQRLESFRCSNINSIKHTVTHRRIPPLSSTSSPNVKNEDENSNGSNTIQRFVKKILKPARKFVTVSAIFTASMLPLKNVKASSTFSSAGITNRPPTKKSEAPTFTSNSFIRDAVKLVGPSVVRVDCEREISTLMTLLNPEAFKEGDTIKVSGSGIAVSTDGYLLTNSHVVQQAKSVTVTLSNGRSFKANVVAFDELTDLAVLKAEIGYYALPKAPLGDSSSLQSGDWVIAVGCPVGLDFTVTLGIVSSPKRSAFEVGAVNLKGTYIQTDAALNSGNSGGPLVDSGGQVIGINTMVRTNTEAIGFAIPINRAKQIYNVLKQGKKPSHAYFGIDIMTLTPDFAR
jgi:S1-C subfamily serine protease